jgi:hypothetical protein
MEKEDDTQDLVTARNYFLKSTDHGYELKNIYFSNLSLSSCLLIQKKLNPHYISKKGL